VLVCAGTGIASGYPYSTGTVHLLRKLMALCVIAVHKVMLCPPAFQEYFQYHWSGGEKRYPRVDSFVGAWMHHYYTKSRQEYARKNTRGSAVSGKRRDEYIPWCASCS
jgi:hypothetical protein